MHGNIYIGENGYLTRGMEPSLGHTPYLLHTYHWLKTLPRRSLTSKRPRSCGKGLETAAYPRLQSEMFLLPRGDILIKIEI